MSSGRFLACLANSPDPSQAWGSSRLGLVPALVSSSPGKRILTGLWLKKQFFFQLYRLRRQTWSVLLPGLRIPTAKPAIGCGLFSTSITLLFLCLRFFLFLCLRFSVCPLPVLLPLSSTCACNWPLCVFVTCSSRACVLFSALRCVPSSSCLFVLSSDQHLFDCVSAPVFLKSSCAFLIRSSSFRKDKVLLVCVCSARERDCEKSRWSLFVRSRAVYARKCRPPPSSIKSAFSSTWKILNVYNNPSNIDWYEGSCSNVWLWMTPCCKFYLPRCPCDLNRYLTAVAMRMGI